MYFYFYNYVREIQKYAKTMYSYKTLLKKKVLFNIYLFCVQTNYTEFQ